MIRSRGDLECARLAASRVVMHEIMGIQRASESDFPSPYLNVLKRFQCRKQNKPARGKFLVVGQPTWWWSALWRVFWKPISLSFDWWSVFVTHPLPVGHCIFIFLIIRQLATQISIQSQMEVSLQSTQKLTWTGRKEGSDLEGYYSLSSLQWFLIIYTSIINPTC